MYGLERQRSLSVFLLNRNVAIDAHHLKRGRRCIPKEQRSWLFRWTEIGAEVVGKIQSLLVTGRLHGINPYTYLVDVFQRINSNPVNDVGLLSNHGALVSWLLPGSNRCRRSPNAAAR